MNNLSGSARPWLLVFCIFLLHGFSYEQSPPRASSSLPPSPRPPLTQLQPLPPLPGGFLQKVPLSLLSAALRLALCPLPQNGGCVWQFSWVIDLPPFPLTTGAQSNITGLHCISNGSRCRWQTIPGYLAEQNDTNAFVPLELHIQAQDISQMLLMGHATMAGELLRQLEVLSIACDNPLPVFAPYLLEPLIMALSAARIDVGVNVSAVAAAQQPPPAPPGVNHTSDAANASLASVVFSRLYAQPTLASPQLRQLTINNCKLTGQLPTDTFWLQLPNLQHLDMSQNMLSGPLPATFGPSPPLSYVNLSYNRITGPLISTHIRYGGCRRTLDLSYNDLRGGIPQQWLASACTLDGKDTVGLSPPRRRRLGEEMYDNWVGPEGGVKIADLRQHVRAAAFKASDSKPTGVVNETNPQASTATGVDGAMAAVSSSTSDITKSAAYAFWLSYPMSYSYGGDNCPSYGIAWDVELASRVLNGTGGLDGAPFPFTIRLYGNPNLRYPGGKLAGYATAPSAYLHFSVRENACSAFDPLPEIVWLWGSFGVCTLVTVAVSVIQGLLAIRRAMAKVIPTAGAQTAAPTSGRTRAAGGTLGGSPLGRAAGSRGQQQQQAGDADSDAAEGSERTRGELQEREGSPPRQREALRSGKGTATPSSAAGPGSGPSSIPGSSSTAPGNPSPTAAATAIPTSAPAAQSTTTTTAITSSGQDASASPTTAPVPAGRPGSGSMARIIIVGHHARIYSRAAAERLSVWGNAVLDGIEAFGEWFFFEIPWAHIIRTLVTFSVHLGAAGLTYVMSRSQRTAYCTTVIDCLPYLYFVPIALSLLAMGVTLFLVRATHMLAGSMTQQLCGSAPGSLVTLGARAWQPLGKGPPRPSGSSPTSTISEEQSGNTSNEPAARANTAVPAAATAEGTLSEPERWISGLQRIRTVAAANQRPSLVGFGPHEVLSSSQSKGMQGPIPPVAVTLPTPGCLSNNSYASSRGRSGGGGGGSSSRNSNPSILSGAPAKPAVAASTLPTERSESPRAAAYVHGMRLGPSGSHTTILPPSPLGRQGSRSKYNNLSQDSGDGDGRYSSSNNNRNYTNALEPADGEGPTVGVVAGAPAPGPGVPSTHNRLPVAESVEEGSGRVPSRQLSTRAAMVANRFTWKLPVAVTSTSTDQDDGGWRSGHAWSQRAHHHANIMGKGGSGDGKGRQMPHASGCRSEPGAAREAWESAGQVRPGRPVGEATEERNSAGPNTLTETSAVLASSTNSGVAVALSAHSGATAAWAGQMPTAVSNTESSTNRVSHTTRAGGVNPWLEDRLNALAVLSSSSMSLSGVAASPMPHADGARRMPSNATAAAVAASSAATPSWRRQTSPNTNTPSSSDTGTPATTTADATATNPSGGMAPKTPTSQTRLKNLGHEALGVVNKFLFEYTLGSSNTPYWPGRVGCVIRSLALVLLCAVPIAPFAAILIVLAFFAVVVETAVRRVVAWARAIHAWHETRRVKPVATGTPSGSVAAPARSSTSFSCSPHFASLRLALALFLGLHSHVAGWVLCLPLAFFTGICYGLGYMWGQDAVPYPWVFLACNAASLAGVLLLLLELGYDLEAWERGVCRYPYEVAVRAVPGGPGAAARTDPRVVAA